MSRRLLIFLLIDLVAVAAFFGWWWNRRAPAPPAPLSPTAQPAPLPVPAPPAPVVAASGAETVAGAAPAAPAGVSELHGTFQGQPFWARLGAPTPEYGGKRRLELVYTPPVPDAVGGSMIHDSPLLLVDDHLALVEWDNRDGATGLITTVAPAGYKLVREVHAAEKIDLLTRKMVGGPAWDLRLAPLLLALSWRADGGECAQRVIDFWGPRVSEKLTLAVRGSAITVGDETWTVEADGDGRLKRLSAADGSELLSVAGRP